VTFEDKGRLLSDLYRAFNRRDLDRVLSALSPTVRWPNVLEKTELRGHAAVRAYWLKQFETIEPRVEPVEFLEHRGDVACASVRSSRSGPRGRSATRASHTRTRSTMAS
jgi:ketosteroid isomerase-like protein